MGWTLFVEVKWKQNLLSDFVNVIVIASELMHLLCVIIILLGWQSLRLLTICPDSKGLCLSLGKQAHKNKICKTHHCLRGGRREL